MLKKKKTQEAAQRFCETCGQPLPARRQGRLASGISSVRTNATAAVFRVQNTRERVGLYRKRMRHLKKLVETIGKLL